MDPPLTPITGSGLLTVVPPVFVPGVGHQPIGRSTLRAPAQDLDRMASQELVRVLLVHTFTSKEATEKHSANNSSMIVCV